MCSKSIIVAWKSESNDDGLNHDGDGDELMMMRGGSIIIPACAFDSFDLSLSSSGRGVNRIADFCERLEGSRDPGGGEGRGRRGGRRGAIEGRGGGRGEVKGAATFGPP